MKPKYLEEKNEIIRQLLEAGVNHTQAEIIADCFATADEWGVTSHGIRILPSHLNKVWRGGYNLSPNIRIVRESPAFAVVDGDNSFGPVSADFCMALAVEKAKSVGVFQVFSRNNNTPGAAFYYTLKAAENGFIGIFLCNSPAQMAPVGGKEKMLGTNPFAVAIPIPGQDPLIIDMATSIVAKSKFKEYKEAGKNLPDGWALDENGLPTNNPEAGMKGFILPMAGFKGYGIAMLIDIISGLLSGSAFLNKVGRFYSEYNMSMNVGFTCIAMNPIMILGQEYPAVIRKYVSTLRNSKTIEGKRIILPGDDRLSFLHSTDL